MDTSRRPETQADDVAEEDERALCWREHAGVALVELDRDLRHGCSGRPEGRVRSRLRRLRLVPPASFAARKFPMPPLPAALLQSEAARAPSRRTSTRWCRSRSTRWRRAAFTTNSAAAFTATAPNAPGPCRTSRRCFTTTPNSARSTPAPTVRRRNRSTSVLQQTLAFVAREMTAPRRRLLFGAGCRREGEEGKFYVWTDKEIDAVLTDKDEAAVQESLRPRRSAEFRVEISHSRAQDSLWRTGEAN